MSREGHSFPGFKTLIEASAIIIPAIATTYALRRRTSIPPEHHIVFPNIALEPGKVAEGDGFVGVGQDSELHFIGHDPRLDQMPTEVGVIIYDGLEHFEESAVPIH